MAIDSEVLERIRGAWRGRLGAPGAFRKSGIHLHVRADTPGERSGADWWAAVVTLADATCLSVPAAAARHLGLDAAGGAEPLPHPADAAAAGRLLGPVADVTGLAVLLFLDPANLNGGRSPARPGAVAAASAATAAKLAAACPPADRDESGILQITSAPWVWREPDQTHGHPAVAAACGYQVWDGGLAQFSVLVHPDHRGRGLGRAVAAAAVRAAVAEGLIPQWRARASLLASRRIAETLGFTEVGWQAVYRLPRPPSP